MSPSVSSKLINGADGNNVKADGNNTETGKSVASDGFQRSAREEDAVKNERKTAKEWTDKNGNQAAKRRNAVAAKTGKILNFEP